MKKCEVLFVRKEFSDAEKKVTLYLDENGARRIFSHPECISLGVVENELLEFATKKTTKGGLGAFGGIMAILYFFVSIYALINI